MNWTLQQILIKSTKKNKTFLEKNLEDVSPFCRATDTPVLEFW